MAKSTIYCMGGPGLIEDIQEAVSEVVNRYSGGFAARTVATIERDGSEGSINCSTYVCFEDYETWAAKAFPTPAHPISEPDPMQYLSEELADDVADELARQIRASLTDSEFVAHLARKYAPKAIELLAGD